MIKNNGLQFCCSPIFEVKMKQISVIPMPNKIIYLGGETVLNKALPEVKIDEKLDKEEYILTVDKDRISVLGGSKQAVFYAIQTLKQLDAVCPCVKIEDKPAYPYRGFMIDTARHIFTVNEIKKLIDAAASVKMNVMHWHLTDDQGFRFYSKRRPKAAELGSLRHHSGFGNLKENGGYGGYYTIDEMKEIVSYCSEKYITAIPEFDVPGHSSALIHAYPGLSCTDEPVAVKTHQGIFKDVICVGKERNFQVICDILSDIIEIFPSEYIHIGGDEVKKHHWKGCLDCQNKMRLEGLENEEELQGWFMNKVIDFLAENGRKAIVWNESLRSGQLKNAVVQRWMHNKKLCVDFANNGGKPVISDFYHYYCDYPYGMTPLKKTYNFNPVIKGMENKSSVAGVEAPVWTEYINSFDYLCYMLFPRVTAVAETGWTLEENKNAENFCLRFKKYSEQLAGMGINSAPLADCNPLPAQKIKELFRFILCILQKN